ncbi:unnamed protein product [Schistosoma margrebowiei]|uniref:Uncharacterized protein n=1 Tax=Schistosoma margrebowiei TaxID=48269 RepID=A0A183N5V9_9TREM|nr:unnamed protein product [Schistosoma margrebowiei]
MKTSTSEGKHRIHCTAYMQLDDLEFEDDLALLSQMKLQIGNIISISSLQNSWCRRRQWEEEEDKGVSKSVVVKRHQKIK